MTEDAPGLRLRLEPGKKYRVRLSSWPGGSSVAHVDTLDVRGQPVGDRIVLPKKPCES